MKYNKASDISRFLTAVQKCAGQIWFNTPEGDELNLKSALSQFVFVAAAAGQLNPLEGEIRLENNSDLPLIRPFVLEA